VAIKVWWRSGENFSFNLKSVLAQSDLCPIERNQGERGGDEIL
jgi:hypothetical protein